MWCKWPKVTETNNQLVLILPLHKINLRIAAWVTLTLARFVVSSVLTGPTLFANSSWYPDISKDKVDHQTTQQSYLGSMVDFDATEDKNCPSVLLYCSQTSRKSKTVYKVLPLATTISFRRTYCGVKSSHWWWTHITCVRSESSTFLMS